MHALMLIAQAAQGSTPEIVGGLGALYLVTHLTTMHRQLINRLNKAERGRREVAKRVESIRLGIMALARATDHPEVAEDMINRERANQRE